MMYIVFQTQHRENYGAHDWDGEGVCPQYWKFKGGDTYIAKVSLRAAQDREFWNALESAIESKSEYFEEYIIGSELIDEIDFVESDHVQEWESPYYISIDDNGEFRANRTTNNTKYGYMRKEIAKKYETFVLNNGERDQYESSFEMINGQILPYKDLGAWFEVYAPEAA